VETELRFRYVRVVMLHQPGPASTKGVSGYNSTHFFANLQDRYGV